MFVWVKRIGVLCMALCMAMGCLACSGDGDGPAPTNRPEPSNKESSYVDVNVIPTPKKLEGNLKGGQYKAFVYDAVISCGQPEWQAAVGAFQDYAKKLFDLSFAEGATGLVLSKDDSIVAGAYRLVTGDTVSLSASSVEGIQLGLSTLLQLISKSDRGMLVPYVIVEDQPDCEWRGFFLDLARVWHEPQMIFEYVDLCYFYKINRLVLHGVDDQSFTWPMTAYPKLSTEGRTYSREVIAELVEYADARGVSLIPGVESPGHCTQLNLKYPSIFGVNGIVCQHEKAFEALETIFDEICALFPKSPYIFMAGDEAALTNWTKCSKCMRYARDNGLVVEGDEEKTVQNMYAHFINRVANMILADGRTPVVSEGFSAITNDLVTKDMIVLSWENYYQTTPDLLAGGFRIVNASWIPLYIVPPGLGWTPEELFNWSIYSWKPMHSGSIYYPEGMTIEPHENVMGGLLLVFGDQLLAMAPGEELDAGLAVEVSMVRERFPAFAEKNWNITSPLPYETFAERSEQVRKLEDKLFAR